jgi:hypothetical protein
MIDVKNKRYLKQILSMYKTFSSIRSVGDNKWKLSYVYENKYKLEKSVDKMLIIRGGELKDPKIFSDADISGYYCFECICESRESAMVISDFLDNQLEDATIEDIYDYPIQGDDY